MNTNRRKSQRRPRRTQRASNAHRKEQERRDTSSGAERCSEKTSDNLDECLSERHGNEEQKCRVHARWRQRCKAVCHRARHEGGVVAFASATYHPDR